MAVSDSKTTHKVKYLNWHLSMCCIYIFVFFAAFIVPWPMNIIQGGLVAVLFPIRLYMGLHDLHVEFHK